VNYSTTNGSTGTKGSSIATTGRTYGVSGFTDSNGTNAAGVYGQASSTTGDVKGVYGVNYSTNGGVAVVGMSMNNRHAGWFETGNYAGVQVKNNAASYYAMAVDNTNTGGYLIGAWNGTDEEFRVDGSGNIYIDGSIYTNQGDYADMLPAIEGLEPGDVLVIGPDGKLTRCTEPNQTALAGVYSTAPGFVGRPLNPAYDEDNTGRKSAWTHEPALPAPTLGTPPPNTLEAMTAELDQGFVPLAITGVVPVKVSAENGPILPGDLLTTSSLPGYAMKALQVEVSLGLNIFRPGTILGKALQGWQEGTGTILVLIVLQ
jgi:hypothetical protein